jgi:putative methionine-R-sulfoxide reductase with GAF domain
MPGFTHPEDPSEKDRLANAGAGETQRLSSVPHSDSAQDNPAFSESELDSALQLLVERAQYITGATGAALALPQGEEMVCRASAGSCAPALGARLQVRSGLTGESIARRQLLRCDNAESDTRVNLEACRALGIASIVVLPLLRRNGEVRGLFELFSDHAYAFEERDLIALERMADLTLTALDLAEQSENIASAPGKATEKTPETNRAPGTPAVVLNPSIERPPNISLSPVAPDSSGGQALPAEAQAISPSSTAAARGTARAPLPVAMHLAQKCSSCGFPVSEGRTLCLDCEKKDGASKPREAEPRQSTTELTHLEVVSPGAPQTEAADPAGQEEFVPAFLVKSPAVRESWLTNPVNLLAFVVLILCILVAVVVFR